MSETLGSGDEYEVESIVDGRVRYRRQFYLVRWKGFGPEGDTWEPEENLAHCKELIKAFHATKRPSRALTPTRSSTPRRQSPARTKAQPRTPPRTKTPERQRKVVNAEQAKPKKQVESDDRPKQIVTPLLVQDAPPAKEIIKDFVVQQESAQLMGNGVITQRNSLHTLKSPVTMRKENGRYPTISEMRDLAVIRSKAKLGIQDPADDFSDGDDENDGPHPKAWSIRWPRWSRHLMVCSLIVVGVGVCVYTALSSLPLVQDVPQAIPAKT